MPEIKFSLSVREKKTVHSYNTYVSLIIYLFPHIPTPLDTD